MAASTQELDPHRRMWWNVSCRLPGLEDTGKKAFVTVAANGCSIIASACACLTFIRSNVVPCNVSQWLLWSQRGSAVPKANRGPRFARRLSRIVLRSICCAWRIELGACSTLGALSDQLKVARIWLQDIATSGCPLCATSSGQVANYRMTPPPPILRLAVDCGNTQRS